MTSLPPSLGAITVALLFALTSLGQAGSPAVTPATPAINVSGMVVDYGDGQVSYALVPFEEDSITGIDVLRRSGLSLLSVEFGAMGEGICAIEETGCDLSACRARLCQTGDPDSAFWQYVRKGDDGRWQAAPLGASSSQVSHGDVQGWFWTGDTPASQAVTLDAIAAEAGVDLQAFRSTHGADQSPVTVTIGDPAPDDAVDVGNILAGGGVFALMTLAGAFLILRSRGRHS
jgi:hypothetical protein